MIVVRLQHQCRVAGRGRHCGYQQLVSKFRHRTPATIKRIFSAWLSLLRSQSTELNSTRRMDNFNHPVFAPSGEQPFSDDFMQQLDFHNLFADDLFLDDDSFLVDFSGAPDTSPDAVPGKDERVGEAEKLSYEGGASGAGAGLQNPGAQPSEHGAATAAKPKRSSRPAASALGANSQNPIAAVTAEFSTRPDVWDDSTPSRLSDRQGPISDAERLAGRVASAAASVAVEGPLDTRAIADRLIARQNRQGGSDDSDEDEDDDEGDGRRRPKRNRRGQGASGDDEDGDDEPSQKRPRRRAATREERVARSRERNRIHARKSRLRKKFFVDSLKASLGILERENQSLRRFLREKLGRSYEELSHEASSAGAGSTSAADGSHSREETVDARAARAASIVARDPKEGTQSLEDGDFQLMLALQVAQQNFVVSDPNLPDNPIVFASDGFYLLTGYSPSEVIGRNCRFLQGPDTDPESVQIIREGVRQGRDTSVCLVNYKKDGTKFWNRFFVAPLRGLDGGVVNFVGVQSEVSEGVARSAIRDMKQKALASRAVAEAISEKRKRSGGAEPN